MRKIIYILAVLAAAAVGCSEHYEPEFSGVDELGFASGRIEIEASRGAVEIPVYSNKPGMATVAGDCSGWFVIQDGRFDGDKVLFAEYLANEGSPRKATVFIETDTRIDTLFVYQKGLEQKFEFESSAMVVYNGRGRSFVPADISVPLRELDIEVNYLSGEGEWIRQYGVDPYKLWIETDDNTDELSVRRAEMILRWKDGWDRVSTERITITQANAKNLLGVPVTFAELRDMATVDGNDIADDVILTCHVGGAPENNQAGECEVIDAAAGISDTESNKLTAYIQEEDGTAGMRIITASADDNQFKKSTKVTLSLKGCKISKSEDVPVRYTISNVKADMLVEAVNTTLARKEKSITELTDDDVYTYVTLKDVELPVRKGSLLPLNGGYTSEFSSGVMSKYPTLVHGSDGGSLYMMTNSNCPYARDGKVLPNGSGSISGIIVHEHYRPYVDFDGGDEKFFGEIGRYQIRHLCREDIALNEKVTEGFSAFVTEFRYADLLYRRPDPAKVLPGGIPATAGTGSMTHTYQSYNSKWGGTSVWNQSVRVAAFSVSYCYLGPCNKANSGQYGNGAGIILTEGVDNFPDPSYSDGDSYFPVDKCLERASVFGTTAEKIYAAMNSEGKGGVYADMMLAWANKYWWNDSESHGYCWLVQTSTAGIVSDHVSVQFSMYNNAQSNYLNLPSPRYWTIQYSTTTSDCTKASDPQWSEIGQFTVPDVVTYGNIKPGQIAGAKQFNFELPLEVLGHDVLYIRLMPRNNRAALHTTADYLYDGGAIKNNSGYNTMDYFAIRYNK